jgi:hypothetical protein
MGQPTRNEPGLFQIDQGLFELFLDPGILWDLTRSE